MDSALTDFVGISLITSIQPAVHDRIIRVAIVGDVHDLWEQEDALALQHLQVDLVLFVGDFGNESIRTVQAIAELPLPKAAIFGNHDAWYSASNKHNKKRPYDAQKEDRVQQQLDLLGHHHIGYRGLDFPNLAFSVIGARPFSWGGATWKNAKFYEQRFGVKNFQDSTDRMMAAVKHSAFQNLIFLGHCGPQGLGDQAEDPCGRDWKSTGGDYGDPDFAEAIQQSRLLGKQVTLVAFGHMHHRLHNSAKLRIPVKVDEAGTIYFNSAIVPRIVKTPTESLRNFSLVTFCQGQVVNIASIWLNQAKTIVSEQFFYQAPAVPSHLKNS